MSPNFAPQVRTAFPQHGLEHRLRRPDDASNDLQYLRGRGLLLQRLAQIVGALAQLVEQPRVLDGDDGLIGESLGQFDLLLRERCWWSPAKIGSRPQKPGHPARAARRALRASPSASALAAANNPSFENVRDMDSGAFDDCLPEHGGLVRLARVVAQMTVPFRRAAVSRGQGNNDRLPSLLRMVPISAPHKRHADLMSVLRTPGKSNVERLMNFEHLGGGRLLLTRLVALAGKPSDICLFFGRTAKPELFGASPRFNVLWRCVFAALSRSLIASPEAQDKAS